MDGFQKRSYRKQQKIIDAAYELYKEQGIQATKVKDIAFEAGVSQVSIYNYFKSKQALTLIVIKHMLEDYNRVYQTLLDQNNTSIKDKFEILLRYEIETLGKFHNDFFESIFNPQDEEVIKLVNEFTEKRIVPIMRTLVQEGKQLSLIREDISDYTIMFYLRLFTQIREMEITHQKKLLNDLIRMFFDGVGGVRND